jgi:large subunit ribosomal protein L2
MGTRIISQRRGRGTITYRSHSFKSKGAVKYVKGDEKLTGKIVDLLHSPGHSAPLAKIKYSNGKDGLLFVAEGLSVGNEIMVGVNAEPVKGNVLPLAKVPAGSTVFNLEIQPGDGGKIVRSSGTFAKVVSKLEGKVVVLLPSKKQKILNENCLATLGVVAGGGRLEKPILKGGKRHYAMRARGRLYPHVSGVAMNPVDHPFGSGRGRNMGKNKTAPRFAPAGRKVGQVAPKRTGRKK